MIYLIGHTGFVGSNLKESFNFDGLFNSKNIQDAFNTNPQEIYYSAVPAKKFIANKFPEEDFKIIQNAIENIKKINPKKIVLISTVDVYENPNGKDEDYDMQNQNLSPYGKNRLYLEEFVKANFTDYLIVRLPALYGKNLKKNFLYDFIKFIPSMLTDEKIKELSEKDSEILTYYTKQDNTFHTLNENIDEKKLRAIFEKLNFSALNFTDDRSMFQFYNLKYLFSDIKIAKENNIKVLNIATEGLTAGEVYKYLTNKDFNNTLNAQSMHYDFRTKHARAFNKKGEYIQNKEFILQDIKEYIKEQI